MATFKEAYAWMLKVQKACLDKPVSVHLDTNYSEGTGRWTVDMYVHYHDECFLCEWSPWSPERFDEGKKIILALLHGIGITLYPKKK